MLTNVNVYMDFVHFITMFSLSDFNCHMHIFLCFCTEMNWVMVSVVVAENNQSCCAFCIFVAKDDYVQNMLLFLKTMHNPQWNHPRLLLAHRVLISLCTSCSKYDTILLLSPDCWTSHVASNFKLKAVCSDLLPVIVKHSFVVVLRGVNVTQVVRHMYIKYLFSTWLNVYIVRGLSMWVLKKKKSLKTYLYSNGCQ